MSETTTGGFITYPTNRVTGTVDDADKATATVADLVAAGFDREAISVLHGEDDLRRLDPSGVEHGLFATIQRSLIRGAAGFELKHLTHHVEDLKAGRFVVMVLAPARQSRDAAAEILHAHGAEFVGFYGRWAYEALPENLGGIATSTGRIYEITAGAETVRVRLESGAATIIGKPSMPAVATSVGVSLWLVSWRADGTGRVHAIDVSTGVAYTSVMTPDSEPTHVKGTVTLIN
jgi:hypothetical protein